jgi:L-lactate dehydrogenase complex protein LldG
MSRSEEARMTARDDILANIRRSLAVTGREAPRRQAVEERLERAPKGVIPERGQVSGSERVALFRQMAEATFATVEEAASAADVPEAVAAYLRGLNLPATVRMGEDLRLKAMPWQSTALELQVGASDGRDLNSVSFAFAGVAETGTLVLTSGAANPTTLNFLPDNHIVVVNAKDIAGDYEEVWSKLRYAHGKGEMPRTVNWVTGPSRSGDIEQVLLLGAHGPRRVHVIIVAAQG